MNQNLRRGTFALLALSLSACRCGPEEATPVTLRLKNTSRGVLFVDDSDGRLGMQVQRRVNFTWQSFVESPACECLSCDVVCKGCECSQPNPPAVLRKVAPGESVERVWSGRVQVGGIASCGSLVGGRPCLSAEVPPRDETFSLKLCYSPSAPSFQSLDGGSEGLGSLPEQSVLCVGREFQPVDGVVEVSPERGADCSSAAQCKGEELCLGGICTLACPANDFPQVGGPWQLRVGEPDDQGFFTVTYQGDQRIYEGTGTISSVLYQNGTMTLRLMRAGAAGEPLNGAVFLTLPPGYSVPLVPGPTVRVKLVDGSTEDNYDQRALVVRDSAGALLLAADTAQLVNLLPAADTAPFTVSNGLQTIGCSHDECGKRLFVHTVFSAGGENVEVEPGKSAQKLLGGRGYQLLSVGNQTYANTHCWLKSLRPYAILKE
ncbi:MAG: hypothetical protein ACOZIN_07445 [Myxococcota bacterium]